MAFLTRTKSNSPIDQEMDTNTVLRDPAIAPTASVFQELGNTLLNLGYGQGITGYSQGGSIVSGGGFNVVARETTQKYATLYRRGGDTFKAGGSVISGGGSFNIVERQVTPQYASAASRGAAIDVVRKGTTYSNRGGITLFGSTKSLPRDYNDPTSSSFYKTNFLGGTPYNSYHTASSTGWALGYNGPFAPDAMGARTAQSYQYYNPSGLADYNSGKISGSGLFWQTFQNNVRNDTEISGGAANWKPSNPQRVTVSFSKTGGGTYRGTGISW